MSSPVHPLMIISFIQSKARKSQNVAALPVMFIGWQKDCALWAHTNCAGFGANSPFALREKFDMLCLGEKELSFWNRELKFGPMPAITS